MKERTGKGKNGAGETGGKEKERRKGMWKRKTSKRKEFRVYIGK